MKLFTLRRDGDGPSPRGNGIGIVLELSDFAPGFELDVLVRFEVEAKRLMLSAFDNKLVHARPSRWARFNVGLWKTPKGWRRAVGFFRGTSIGTHTTDAIPRKITYYRS